MKGQCVALCAKVAVGAQISGPRDGTADPGRITCIDGPDGVVADNGTRTKQMKKSVMIGALLGGLALAGVAGAQTAPAPAATAPQPAPGPRGPMPDFATLDADGNGAVTPEEMQAKAAARFAAADTDGDGGLSAAELQAQEDQRRAARLNRMIAARDTNGDGLLQADEMAPKGDRMTRMFDRIDTNKDGSIDAAEFEAAPRMGPGNHHDGHGKPHGRMDGDHGPRPRG